MKLSWSKMLILGWITIFIAGDLPSKIEGNLFPVVKLKEFQFSESAPTVITGEINRLRNCDIEEIKWYIKKGEYKSRLNFYFTPRIEEGISDFGPFTTNLSPTYLKENSEVYGVYSCHILWNTITKIY